MAYSNYLVAVATTEIDRIRLDSNYRIAASDSVRVSHLLAGRWGWLQSAPLASAMSRLLDGGEKVSEALWHPLRVPLYHQPNSANSILTELVTAWHHVLLEHQLADDDWARVQIESATALLERAILDGNGIFSILSPPFDGDRAGRVTNPLQHELW